MAESSGFSGNNSDAMARIEVFGSNAKLLGAISRATQPIICTLLPSFAICLDPPASIHVPLSPYLIAVLSTCLTAAASAWFPAWFSLFETLT
ncbi:MAG: hypothetical protein Q9200_000768 [Gallowayella weberi]